MAAPALAQNATRAQALAYLNSYWGSAVYKNSQSTPYNGKTAAQIYGLLETSIGQRTSPHDIAVQVQDLMLSSAVAQGIGQGVTEGTTAIGDSATALGKTSFLPNPLTGLDAIGSFFGTLTSANTWIRVAKVLVGGIVLVIGLAHITGASNAVAQAARKVPLPV